MKQSFPISLIIIIIAIFLTFPSSIVWAACTHPTLGAIECPIGQGQTMPIPDGTSLFPFSGGHAASIPGGGTAFFPSGFTFMQIMAAMASMSQAMESMMGPSTAQSQANVTNSVTGSLNQQPAIPNPTQNLFTVFSEVPADKRVVLASATNTLLTDLDHGFRGDGEPISDMKVVEDAKSGRRVQLQLPGRVHESILNFDDEDTQETRKTDPFNTFVKDTLTGEGGLFRGITELFQSAKKGIRFLARESIEEELEEDIDDLERDLDLEKSLLSDDKGRLNDRLDDLREARKAVNDAQTPGNKLRAKQALDTVQDAVDEAKDTVDASQDRVNATQDKLGLAKKQLEAFDKQIAEQEQKERQNSTTPFSFKPGFLGIPKQEEKPSPQQFQLNPKLGLEFPSKGKGDTESFPPGGQVEQNMPGTNDGAKDFQQAKVDLLGGDDEGFTAPEKTEGSITDRLQPLRLRSMKQSERAQAAFNRSMDARVKLDEARLNQRGLAIDVERAVKDQKAIQQEPPSTARTLRLRNANQAVIDAKDALEEANQEVEKLKNEYEVLGAISDKEMAASKEALDAYFTASAIESGKIVLKSLGIDPEGDSSTSKAGPSEEEIIPFQKDPNNNQWLKRARDLWDDSFGTFLGKGPPKPIRPPPFDPSLIPQKKMVAPKTVPSTSEPPGTVEQSFDGPSAGPGFGFEQLGAGAGDFLAEGSQQNQGAQQDLTPEQQEKIKRLQIMEKKLALALAEGGFDSDSSDKNIQEIREALDILEGRPIFADLGIFESGSKKSSEKVLDVREGSFVEVPSDFARDVGVDFGEKPGSETAKNEPKDSPKKAEVAKETFQEVPSDFLKDIGVDIEKGLTTTPSSGQKPTEFIDKGSFDQTGVDFLGPGAGQDLLTDDGGGFIADDSGGKNQETDGDSSKGQSSGQSGQGFADRRFQEVQNELTAKRKDLTDAKGELAEAEKNLRNIQKNPNAPANRLARPGAEQDVKDAQAKVDGLKEGIEQLQQQSTKFAKSADSAQKGANGSAGLKGQNSEPNDEVQKLIDRAVQGDKEAMKALGGKVGGSSGDDLQKLLDAANKGDGKAQDEIYFELLGKAKSGDKDAQELLRYLEGLAKLGGAETGKTLAEQLRTQQREVRKQDREIRKLKGEQQQAEQDLDQLKKGRREASAALGKGGSSKFRENLKKFNDLGKELSKQKAKLDGINDKLQEAKKSRDAEAKKAVELMQSIRALNQRDVQDKREAKKRNSSSTGSSGGPSFNKDPDVEQGLFDFGFETMTENLGAGGDGFQALISDDESTQLIEDLKAEIEARERDLREFPGLDLKGMAKQAAKKAADALANASFFQWSTFQTTAQEAAEKELNKLLGNTPTAFQSETPDERRNRLRQEFPRETADQIEARAVTEEQKIEENLDSKDKDGQEVIGEEIMIDKVAKAKLARNIAIDIGQAAGTAFSTGTREDLEKAAEGAVDEELQNQEELRMLQTRVDSKGLEALEQKLTELQNSQEQGSRQGDNQRAEGSSGDSDASFQGQGDGMVNGQGSPSQIFNDLQAEDARNAAPVQPISFSNAGSNQTPPRQGGVLTSPSNRPLILNSVP